MGRVLEVYQVAVHGDGPQTVVLANGFGTTQQVWQAQVERLRSRYRVVTFDWAGSTAATEAAYQASRHDRLFGFAEDLVDIVEDLDLRGAAFVGHSVSGMIGMLAVNAEPDLFSRLVLIGASARYIDEPAAGYPGGFSVEHVDEIQASMAQDFVEWANGFSRATMGNPEQPDFAAGFASSLKVLRPDIASAVLGMILRSDHRPDAERFGQHGLPTLLLQTQSDVAVPLGAAEWLARATGGELQLVGADGHYPHVVVPEIVNRAILDFLERDAG